MTKSLHSGGLHSECCLLKNGVQGITVTNNDHTIEISEMIEDIALSHLELRPKEIWRHISTVLNRQSPLWTGLTDKAVIRMVGNVREKAYGGDIFRTIESHILSIVKDSPFRFL